MSDNVLTDFPITAQLTRSYSYPGGATTQVEVSSGVIMDAAACGAGYSPGDGIIIPAQIAIGGFKGQLLGFSLKYTAYSPPCPVPGPSSNLPLGCKLGRLYAGIVEGPGAQTSGKGWASMPRDSSLVQEVWNGLTDNPFPLGNPTLVADSRLFGYQLPQPLDIDNTVPIGIGMWLSPMLGPPTSTVNDTTWAPVNPDYETMSVAVAVVSATMTLILSGQDVTPTL